MAVTTPLTPEQTTQFQTIADETIASGGLNTQTSFMNKAREQGLETNPLSNRIWANTLKVYNDSLETTDTTGGETEDDGTKDDGTEGGGTSDGGDTDETVNGDDTGDNAGDLDDLTQDVIDETDAGATLGNAHTQTLQTAYADMQDMDDEFNAITAEITAQYKQRFDNLNLVNKGIKGNTFTANLVSGRARYASKIAEGNLGAAETAAQGRVSALTADMNKEISLAKQVAKTGAKADYQALSNHLATIRDIQADRITAANDALLLSVNIDKWGSEQAKFDREELEADMVNVSSSLFSTIDPNLSTANQMAIVNQAAEDNGFDAGQLWTNLTALRQEDDAYKLDFATKLNNISKTIKNGETQQVGDYLITGTKDPKEIQKTSIFDGIKYNEIWREGKDGKYELIQRMDGGAAYKPREAQRITLSEAIDLGDRSLAGQPYSALQGQQQSPVSNTALNIIELKKDKLFTGAAADNLFKQEMNALAQAYGFEEGSLEYDQLNSMLNQEIERVEQGLTPEQYAAENEGFASDFETPTVGEELGEIAGAGAVKAGELVGDKLKKEPQIVSEIVATGIGNVAARELAKKFFNSSYTALKPFLKEFGKGFKTGVTN